VQLCGALVRKQQNEPQTYLFAWLLCVGRPYQGLIIHVIKIEWVLPIHVFAVLSMVRGTVLAIFAVFRLQVKGQKKRAYMKVPDTRPEIWCTEDCSIDSARNVHKHEKGRAARQFIPLSPYTPTLHLDNIYKHPAPPPPARHGEAARRGSPRSQLHAQLSAHRTKY
jgi:hypothetical protein